MRLALILLAAFPLPAVAERVDCRLAAPCPGVTICPAAPVAVSFEIDRNQFAPPLHKNDPPRNKVTHVAMGGIRFAAEPILIGEVRGFWEDAEALGSRMLVVQPDGTARYSETASGMDMTGSCEVLN